MRKAGAVGDGVFTDVQPDAGIPFPAMPVTPVALDLAEPHRQLVDRCLDLLQAQDVGLFLVDELPQLRFARAYAVHIPRCDLHGNASTGAVLPSRWIAGI